MVIAPFCRPAVPIPATARPTINILDDVATPHSRDPNSNRAKKEMNDHCQSGGDQPRTSLTRGVFLGLTLLLK